MNLRPRALDCVVVGGGAAGAATALGLARGGRTVAMVERGARPDFAASAPVTRVTTLNAASIDLLDDLGVRSAVLARRGHAFRGMEVWDARSPALIRFDADDMGVPALGWTVELLALEASLWEAAASAGVEIIEKSDWRALDWRGDAIDLHLADGRALRARLLVAADGGESRLRTQAGIGVRRHSYQTTGVVATVATAFPHQDTAWQRFDGEEILAFLPLADGRSSIVWSLPGHRAGEVLALDDAAFMDVLGNALGGRLGRIMTTGPRFAFPLTGRQADDYRRDRLVLVGDAAHTVHPLAGQGLNLGLADVRELLAAVESLGAGDPGRDAALTAYTRRRRMENEAMLRAMETFRWLFRSEAPPLVAARGTGVLGVNRSHALKRFFTLRALGS